jgi:glycyl-tRNA synthetase beta chain
MRRLILEIGTEAIPAGYVPRALEELRGKAEAAFLGARLGTPHLQTLGTAKRLVLDVKDVASRQDDLTRDVQGPRADIAFKDGKPTAAAEGFAKKNGVPVSELERVTTEKGEFLLARVEERGREAEAVLPDLLRALIEGLTWPKTMVWNATGFRFPRPIRWVVCLLDDKILPVTVAGIAAGRETRGHWLLGPGRAAVKKAGDLDNVLRDRGVVLDPTLRRTTIEEELTYAAASLGGNLVPDPGLLDEVVFLTEYPMVLTGRCDAEFLELPREVVVTAMRSHQRYFAVEKDGRLLPNFLVVCDGKWRDVSQVVAGNERVLRARLADARFYWNMDRKTGLDALSQALSGIVWLEAIGTMGEKTERVTRLVEHMGPQWFPGEWPGLRDASVRAARLAKADLASEMIKDGKEFTGLQGLMGARYAEAAGEPEALAQALVEQYLPRGTGGDLPATPAGMLLAFADRLDSVAGCFAAGFVPSGSQDPYALRRAANGMVRLLMEKRRHVSLRDLVTHAVEQLPARVRRDGLAADVLGFLSDRTAFYLRERGIPYDVVDAVLAADADDPLDVLARAEALQVFRGGEALGRLVVGCKRAANILKGIDEAGLPDPAVIDWSRATPAEAALWMAIGEVGRGLHQAREQKDYRAMLDALLTLRAPIDRFFDDVLVMSEDRGERERRLGLLAAARGLFHHFFDPARIVIEGETADAKSR